MTNIGDGFKNIFLAGIGAMAYTGEKGKEIIDQLVEKGEITLDQGKQLNEELQHKANASSGGLREGALEATMRMMKPEDREAFAAAAAKFAAEQNAADAERAAQKEQAGSAAAQEVQAGTVPIEADADAPAEGEAQA